MTVTLLAGTITAIAIPRHYLHAAPLVLGASSGWAPPDNVDTSTSPSRLIAAVRRGHDQSFLVSIYNPSSVTQTVLGLTPTNGPTSQPPDRIEVSSEPQYGRNVTIDRLHYERVPVAFPPHTDRVLRYPTHVNSCWFRGRADTWTDLELRVKVGAFTRIERIKLRSHFVLVARHATC